MDKLTSIVIVDDHQLFREGLKRIFELEKIYKIVGEAKNGDEAVQVVTEREPDIMVLDLNIPGISGMEVCRRVCAQFPETKVVVLTMHRRSDYVSDAFSAGAEGYVLKHSAADELLLAVRAVLQNKKYVSSELTGEILQPFVESEQQKNRVENALTDREKEIIRLVAQGYSTKEIGKTLFISPATVKTHRSNLMRKLDLHKNVEIVQYAIKQGLVEL